MTPTLPADLEALLKRCSPHDAAVVFMNSGEVRSLCEEIKRLRASSVSPASDGVLREALTEALGQSLSGSYDCGRVWEAWSVGTMRQDDFSPIEDRLDEIVDEVMDGLPKGRMFTRNELYEFERACSGRPKIAPPDSPIGQVIEAALAKGAEADV